jgi:hypothetical protein
MALFPIILVFTLHFHVAFPEEVAVSVSNGGTIVWSDLTVVKTGDIYVGGNSTLILRNVLLQLSIRGEKSYNITVADHSTLILEASNVTSLSGLSTITVANSSNILLRDGSSLNGFQTLNLNNASLTSIVDGTLKVNHVNGSTRILELARTLAPDTQINITAQKASANLVEAKSVQLAAGQLEVKDLKVEVFTANCSVSTLNRLRAKALYVNASSDVYIHGAEADVSTVYSPLNATLTDSTFGVLTVGVEGQVYNVTTFNAPLTRAGGIIYTYGNLTVKRYWYLQVNVTDITGVPVPADVEVRDYNMTLTASGKAGVDGVWRTPLLAEVITNSTPLFLGNYKIYAHYGNYAAKLDNLVLDTNKNVRLTFLEEVQGLTSITLTVNPPRLQLGGKVTVSGRLTPPIPGSAVELTFIKPDGLKLIQASITDEAGAFTAQLTPDIPGDWTVRAYWLGGEAYLKDWGLAPFSRPAAFHVDPKPTPMKIMVRIFPILIVLIVVVIGVAFLFIQKRKTP